MTLTSSQLKTIWSRLQRAGAALFQRAPGGHGETIAAGLAGLPPLVPPRPPEPRQPDLGPALLDVKPDPLRRLLRDLQPMLCWTLQDPPQPHHLSSRGYVELIGPDGIQKTDGFRWGLFWQQAQSRYPLHRHQAKELYYVLSGTANWLREGERPTRPSPGSWILHSSGEGHGLITAEEPVLAFWSWEGDLDPDSYTFLRPEAL